MTAFEYLQPYVITWLELLVILICLLLVLKFLVKKGWIIPFPDPFEQENELRASEEEEFEPDHWKENLKRMDEIKRLGIPRNICLIREWKKNANQFELKQYHLLAPIFFPDRDSLADSSLLLRLITAINTNCKEDREKRKAPKPRWIHQ